jgi:hypothetical protein
MVKRPPPPPFKKLADLLVTKQGGGKTRRLRRKVTAAEVAEAVSLLRTYCPDADLLDRWESHAVCQKVLAAALAPNRKPHPDQNWDLVSVYAGLRGLEWRAACVELGLASKVKSGVPIEWKLAQARELVRLARQHHHSDRVIEAAKRFLGLVEVERDMMKMLDDESKSPTKTTLPPEDVEDVEDDDDGW